MQGRPPEPPRRTDSLIPTREVKKKSPRSYIKPLKGAWPEGELEDDAPPEVHLIRDVVLLFEHYKKTRKPHDLETIANRIQVSRTTLQHLRAGKTWPDALVIARLEILWNVRLWNKPHRDASSTKRRRP